MKKHGVNKRAFFRVGTKLDAVLRIGNRRYNAIVVDISTGGMQIESDRELPVNEIILVTFELDNHRMTAFCKIVRAAKGVDLEYLYGCKYDYVSKPDMKRICSFIFDTQALERWA